MTEKLKKAGIILLPFLAAFLVFLFYSEAVARYRTELTFRIDRPVFILRTQVFDLPGEIGDQTYDRFPKTVGIDVPEGVTVGGVTEATDAGEYEITLTIENPETGEWADGTKEPKTVRWRILPRPVPIPTATGLEQVYSGERKMPTVTGLDAVYAETAGTVSTAEAGRHRLLFRLKDARNTVWEDGTTADIPTHWLVAVCRIGETLYPSVTEAFETDRSVREHPVELLCHWSETAVNETGTDFFSTNGFSLESDGVTMLNRGTLTLLGNGPIRSAGGENQDHAAVKNEGTLTVEAGEYTAAYSGSATGGAEVYALWNSAGTMTVETGTFTATGADLAADGLYVSGGTVRVNGGTFSAENRGTAHGAYAIWMDGGTVSVYDGAFHCRAEQNGARGYMVTSGTLTIGGGTTTVTGGSGQDAVVASAAGNGKIRITGGTHSSTGTGGVAGLTAENGGTLEMSGGTAEVLLSGNASSTANGVLVTGGTFRMSGGQVALFTDVGGGASGIGVASGNAVITGGTVSVELSGNGRAYGVNVRSGTCTTEHLTLSVSALSGRAFGFIKSSTGTLEVRSGAFTVSGDVASTGEGNSSASRIITPPANVDCAFTIFYKSSWSAGTNWANMPYVRSAEQIRSRGLLSGTGTRENGRAGTVYGTLPVGGGLAVFFVEAPETAEPGGYRELTLGEYRMLSGNLQVSAETGSSGVRLRIGRSDVESSESGETSIKSDGKTTEPAEAATEQGGDPTASASAAAKTTTKTVTVRRGLLVISAAGKIPHLREAMESGFLESLAENAGSAGSDEKEMLSPSFVRTGFVWVFPEGGRMTVRVATNGEGQVTELEILSEPVP